MNKIDYIMQQKIHQLNSLTEGINRNIKESLSSLIILDSFNEELPNSTKLISNATEFDMNVN